MKSTALVDPMGSVRAYLAAETSPNTRRAYGSDWADFLAWCENVTLQPLPASPVTVAKYLAQLADRKLATSTIGRRQAAIGYAHKVLGHPVPTSDQGVKATMRGIRRTLGTKPRRQAAPAVAAAIATMLEQLPQSLQGLRDRAILLLGFAAALRRSEIAAIEILHLEPHELGLILHIDQSKTDQEGAGQIVPVPHGVHLKPVAALQAWLEAAEISSGPVFRAIDRHGNIAKSAITDRSISRIVKRAAAISGLEATTFSGHSLRAGFITQALGDGVDFFKIMDITRHTEVQTLRIYDRRGRGFKSHAGDGFL